jgi:16S rRNA (cytosine967-C5)-methyltransferase
VTSRPPHRKGTRRHRGRPASRAESARREAAPTQARLLALRVLVRVERLRSYADLALHAALSSSALGRLDRALATELVYGTLRWRGRLDYLLSHVLDRDLEKFEPLVLTALRLGAYQLAFSERIPPNAAVDQSVRCVRAAGLERATGVVNAVLRRLSAELATIALPSLDDDPLGHLTHALSLPRWLAERWLAEFGCDETAALVRAQNQPPPHTVRVNSGRTTRDALLDDLRERFPDASACRFSSAGISLGRRGNPGEDPAFLDGRFTIQDEAAQLVVDLLDPRPGDAILDACAAPGAKATAIAERAGSEGRVVALDRNARRLGLLERDARRLGLTNIEARHRDATQPLDPELPHAFDRLLLDVPCSGLGTLRRNPDLRWRVRPHDPAQLAKVQLAILRNTATCLKPGGSLVYSTCTLLPEENGAVIEAFLSESSAFRSVPREALPAVVQPLTDPGGVMRCLPHLHDTDGFYAVRLERVR